MFEKQIGLQARRSSALRQLSVGVVRNNHGHGGACERARTRLRREYMHR